MQTLVQRAKSLLPSKEHIRPSALSRIRTSIKELFPTAKYILVTNSPWDAHSFIWVYANKPDPTQLDDAKLTATPITGHKEIVPNIYPI